eukprot:1165717-Prorocentrum_minimum.AAC.3
MRSRASSVLGALKRRSSHSRSGGVGSEGGGSDAQSEGGSLASFAQSSSYGYAQSSAGSDDSEASDYAADTSYLES